jgi:hypothetical protein
MAISAAQGAALQSTLLPKAFHSLAFFWLTLGVSIAYATVYVATDLNLFYDGGLFSFLVATGRPWDLFWCNFPARFANLLLTVFPARLFGDVTGSGSGAVLVYAILYSCWPTLGVLATRFLDSTADKHFSAYCNVATLTTPFYTFGFPTEIWILFGLFWPLLCCFACTQQSFLRLGAALVLLPLFLFTHETAILFLPILAWVAISSCHGWQRVTLLTAIVVVAAGWIAVKALVPLCFPWRASPLWLLIDRPLINMVSVGIAVAMTGWLVTLVLARITRLGDDAATYLPLAAGAAVLVLYLYLTADWMHGLSRYPARVLVVLQTFALACICVGLFVIASKHQPGAGWASKAMMNALARLGPRIGPRIGPSIRLGLVAFVGISVVAHGYAALPFVGAWIALNRELDQIVTNGAPVPAGFALATLADGRVTIVTGADAPTRAFRLASGSIAAHVIMRAPGFETKRLLVPGRESAIQHDCEYGKSIERAPGAIGPSSATLSRLLLCRAQ